MCHALAGTLGAMDGGEELQGRTRACPGKGMTHPKPTTLTATFATTPFHSRIIFSEDKISLRQQKKSQAHSKSWHTTTSHSDDEERSVSEPLDLDPEDLLGTIEQVEETLTIMTTVVSQLKEQLMEQLGVVDARDMSVEEFLEICENSDGVLH